MRHTEIPHGAADGVAAGGEQELDEPRRQEAPRAGHAGGDDGAPLRRRLHAAALASDSDTFSLLGSALCVAECPAPAAVLLLARWVMVDVRSTAEGSEGDRRSRRPVWRVLRIFFPPFFLYV